MSAEQRCRPNCWSTVEPSCPVRSADECDTTVLEGGSFDAANRRAWRARNVVGPASLAFHARGIRKTFWFRLNAFKPAEIASDRDMRHCGSPNHIARLTATDDDPRRTARKYEGDSARRSRSKAPRTWRGFLIVSPPLSRLVPVSKVSGQVSARMSPEQKRRIPSKNPASLSGPRICAC